MISPEGAFPGMWEGKDDQPRRCVELGLPRAVPAARRNLLQPQHPAGLLPTPTPKPPPSHQLSLGQASTLREDSEGGGRFGRNGRKGKTAKQPCLRQDREQLSAMLRMLCSHTRPLACSKRVEQSSTSLFYRKAFFYLFLFSIEKLFFCFLHKSFLRAIQGRTELPVYCMHQA